MTRSILILSLSILASPVHEQPVHIPAPPPPKLLTVFLALSRAAHEANLPMWLVFNMAYYESSLRANCITWHWKILDDGSRVRVVTARGLMQINPKYQDELVRQYLGWHPSQFDWSNAVHSAKLGCRYLSSLVRRFGMWKGVAAYNTGPGRVNEWPMHRPLPDETWEYCHRIFTRA